MGHLVFRSGPGGASGHKATVLGWHYWLQPVPTVDEAP